MRVTNKDPKKQETARQPCSVIMKSFIFDWNKQAPGNPLDYNVNIEIKQENNNKK